MTEQITLDDIDEVTEWSQATEQSVSLFTITDDPFVNEAIGDLARELQATTDIEVTVSATAVTLTSEEDLEVALDVVQSLIEDRLEYTHVRTDPARQINEALSETGATQADERWVPPPDRPFPGSEGALTIYEEDSIDADQLESASIDPEKVLRNQSSSRQLYSTSPEFVGNPNSISFPYQIDRFEACFDSFAASLLNDVSDDATCMNCGRDDMPAETTVEGDDLEYNQTFTPLAATSGQAGALGYSSRVSAHSGRCAACLVAGFYYSVMEKLVRPTGTDDNDSRVFCPVGNIEQLATIRSDFYRLPAKQEIDPPLASKYQGRKTLGRLRTDAHGMQIIEFYEQVLRHLNTVVDDAGMFERELRYRPTALISYISKVDQTRDIRNVKSIDPDEWAYEACRRRELQTEDSSDSYWPVEDVLGWFAALRLDDENQHIIIQNDLAFGVLEQSLERLEHAVFETTKLLDRSEEAAPYVPHPGYRSDYFQFIMNQAHSTSDSIDDEALESIRRVGSAIGRVFHGQDDIGVLIKLQNATTPSTFLQAFEKAAMQAQKRSHDDPPTRFEASRDDDVSRVLELINDPDSFDAVKRMFVIHASLAAQYESISDRSDTETDGADTATASEGGD